MATYTENYSLKKPGYSDVADVADINNNMDTIDDVVHKSQLSLAPPYDENTTYNVGDVVMQGFLMYICNDDNVTGAWDSTKWDRTTSAEVGAGGSEVSITPSLQSGTKIADYEIDGVQGELYAPAGGGGGSSVVPNPQGTPTDTLETVQIDNTVYDIAGSGGNVYGAFIDTDRVIASSDAVSFVDYTAVEDCYIMLNIEATSTGSAWAYVDGELVGRLYTTQGASLGTIGLYVKAGQRVTTTNTGTIGQYFRVYGLTFGTNNIFTPQIYSLEEREIGVWVDNKPLYQKTIILNVPINTTFYVDISDLNIDKVISVNGVFNRDTGWYPINTYYSSNFYSLVGVESQRLRISLFVEASYEQRITILYTKTTDVAGSGKYNTLGVPTHHYSTDEQVVGTWFGETLYEKSYRLSTPLIVQGNGTWVSTGIDISDVDYLVNCEFGIRSATWNSINGVNDSGILKAVLLPSGSLTVDTITIRYTKSS